MRNRIPPAVWVAAVSLLGAIVALGLLTAQATQGPGWGQIIFASLVGALILGGILGRRRLAWLWGHYLSLLLALLQAATFGTALYQGVRFPLEVTLLLGGIVAALLLAWFALGRRSSLEYFALVCPACGTPSRMGADFLFRQARCRKCGNVW